jgi:hypothetical protein
MATGSTADQNATGRRSVHCKEYHRAKTRRTPGSLRDDYDRKSTCPPWASDRQLQQALIDGALEDSGGLTDYLGRPKKLWNAVEGVVFVGVSCNLQEPRYNCYPEIPPDGKLLGELQRRAERTRTELLGRPGGR